MAPSILNKLLRRSPHLTNQCKQCRLATQCLPAKLSQELLKRHDQLGFKARILKPGEYLCHQGQHAHTLYALRSGILKSTFTQEDGQELVMGFHLPPSLFGWEGLDDAQESHSIIALDHSSVCEIPLTQLTQLTLTLPELQAQLLHLASRRIHHGNLALLRGSAQQRVASFLLQLADCYTQTSHFNHVCLLKMTHQDIANYLRIAPETISRAFKQLQNEGVITVARKKIYLTNLAQLKVIANHTD